MSRNTPPKPDLEAQFRHAVIGELLASPPPHGELEKRLEQLASRSYEHPENGLVHFGFSTLERWFYLARGASDPILALRRHPRSDRQKTRAITPEEGQQLVSQYKKHPGWSYQLHHDNLKAWKQKRAGEQAKKETTKEQEPLDDSPAYTTVRRWMKASGMVPKRRKRIRTRGQRRALERLEQREVRSYETSHVHGVWHADFHTAHRHVVDHDGTWFAPKALCFIDDRSRVVMHLQWYRHESAETFVHGLIQALLKRGLPRALMTDNGKPMLSDEVQNGLMRWGITFRPTLPYSPHQNAKQESFWGTVEGRFMPMLEGEEGLTLAQLNQATQAWIECEYVRKHHESLGMSPMERLLSEPDVAREAPSMEELQRAFTRRESRRQRRSDGTVSIGGVRYEIPSRFRHVPKVWVRFRSWDRSVAYLVDERTDAVLARLHPQDKERNADSQRRALEPAATPMIVGSDQDFSSDETTEEDAGIAPLLERYIQEYESDGLSAGYLPLRERGSAADAVENDASRFQPRDAGRGQDSTSTEDDHD